MAHILFWAGIISVLFSTAGKGEILPPISNAPNLREYKNATDKVATIGQIVGAIMIVLGTIAQFLF